MSNKDKINISHAEDEETGSGDAGGKGTSSNGGAEVEIWIPGFNDFIKAPEDQEQLRDYAIQLVEENRIALHARKYQVEALKKERQRRESRFDLDNLANNNGGGPNFKQHPELPHMDGKIDPNIVLPNSNDNKNGSKNANKNKLKNNLKPNMQQLHKLKYAPTITIKEELTPRSSPVKAPKLTPGS